VQIKFEFWYTHTKQDRQCTNKPIAFT